MAIRSNRPGGFLSEEERGAVERAIAAAERETSGEIRVHISRNVKGDPLEAASRVFARLGMHQTAARNGVLIYISVADHRFAIVGESLIRYTEEVVLPRIDASLAELEAAPVPAGEAGRALTAGASQQRRRATPS